MFTPLSWNVTLPVGVPDPEPVTAAVNVTDWPKTDGVPLEPNVTVVFDLTVTLTSALLDRWPSLAESRST